MRRRAEDARVAAALAAAGGKSKMELLLEEVQRQSEDVRMAQTQTVAVFASLVRRRAYAAHVVRPSDVDALRERRSRRSEAEEEEDGDAHAPRPAGARARSRPRPLTLRERLTQTTSMFSEPFLGRRTALSRCKHRRQLWSVLVVHGALAHRLGTRLQAAREERVLAYAASVVQRFFRGVLHRIRAARTTPARRRFRRWVFCAIYLVRLMREVQRRRAATALLRQFLTAVGSTGAGVGSVFRRYRRRVQVAQRVWRDYKIITITRMVALSRMWTVFEADLLLRQQEEYLDFVDGILHGKRALRTEARPAPKRRVVAGAAGARSRSSFSPRRPAPGAKQRPAPGAKQRPSAGTASPDGKPWSLQELEDILDGTDRLTLLHRDSNKELVLGSPPTPTPPEIRIPILRRYLAERRHAHVLSLRQGAESLRRISVGDRLAIDARDARVLVHASPGLASLLITMHMDRAQGDYHFQAPSLSLYRQAKRDLPALVEEGLRRARSLARVEFATRFVRGELKLFGTRIAPPHAVLALKRPDGAVQPVRPTTANARGRRGSVLEATRESTAAFSAFVSSHSSSSQSRPGAPKDRRDGDLDEAAEEDDEEDDDYDGDGDVRLFAQARPSEGKATRLTAAAAPAGLRVAGERIDPGTMLEYTRMMQLSAREALRQEYGRRAAQSPVPDPDQQGRWNAEPVLLDVLEEQTTTSFPTLRIPVSSATTAPSIPLFASPLTGPSPPPLTATTDSHPSQSLPRLRRPSARSVAARRNSLVTEAVVASVEAMRSPSPTALAAALASSSSPVQALDFGTGRRAPPNAPARSHRREGPGGLLRGSMPPTAKGASEVESSPRSRPHRSPRATIPRHLPPLSPVSLVATTASSASRPVAALRATRPVG
jgi:hypothetical protein